MDPASPTRFARRSLLKAAVLGRREETDIPGNTEGMDKGETAGRSLLYTITGRILDEVLSPVGARESAAI